MSLNVFESLQRYIRHIPHCQVLLDGNHVNLNKSWNTEKTIFSRIIKEPFEYELHWGISPNAFQERHFFASNKGFLITERPTSIVPHCMPDWIAGEINFYPGVVDLNLARDSIIFNEKSNRIQQKLHWRLREFLQDFSRKLQSRSGSFRQIREHVVWTFMLYNSMGRQIEEGTGYLWLPSPPLSIAETDRLTVDLLYFEYGEKGESFPLAQILDNLRSLGISKLYFYEEEEVVESTLVDFMRKRGYFIFKNHKRWVFLPDHQGIFAEISLVDALRPIVGDLGFKLNSISNVLLEDIRGLPVQLGGLPSSIRSIIKEIRLTSKLFVVDLPMVEPVFQLQNSLYLNIGHPILKDIVKEADRFDAAVLRAFIRGTLRLNL